MNSRTIVVALTSGAFLVGTHANACPEYVGRVVKLQSYVEASSKLPKIPPKSEFETTDGFRARVASASSGESLIVTRPGVADVRYDADKGGFLITRDSIGLNPLSTWDVDIMDATDDDNKKIELGSLFIAGQTLLVSDTTSASGSYTGSNAFGARMVIKKYAEQIRALVDLDRSYRPQYTPGALVSVGVDEAKKYKDNLTIAYVFRPDYPFILRGTVRQQPTIADPRDVSVSYAIMTGKVACALLVDGLSGRVLGALGGNGE